MTGKVTWRDVDSSNVEKVAWFKLGDTPCAAVSFKNGSCYAYIGVTRQRMVAMMRAASVGRYFAQNIKGRYDWMKIC